MITVSVIILNYNHGDYLWSCLQSVCLQTYQNIEIIIVDDASTDHSPTIIQNIKKSFPTIKIFTNKENKGSTKAFNLGLSHSTGDWIIDLAADDYLFPDFISSYLSIAKQDEVIFGNAIYVNKDFQQLSIHYTHDQLPPTGDLFQTLVSKYFIAAPTMMVPRKIMQELKGYDENLYYEDFDFWIRSSRSFNYRYCNKVLIGIRQLPTSLGNQRESKIDRFSQSTFEVCQKIADLIESKEEKNALKIRIQYEYIHAIVYGHVNVWKKYETLAKRLNIFTIRMQLCKLLSKLPKGLLKALNNYRRLSSFSSILK